MYHLNKDVYKNTHKSMYDPIMRICDTRNILLLIIVCSVALEIAKLEKVFVFIEIFFKNIDKRIYY